MIAGSGFSVQGYGKSKPQNRRISNIPPAADSMFDILRFAVSLTLNP